MAKHTAPTVVQSQIGLLDSIELYALAKELPLIEAWIGAVKLELERRLIAGEHFGYVVMRDKLAIRKWDDSIDIQEILTDYMPLEEAAPRVPLSPSKAEKILGREKFEALTQYVRKESSGQTLGFVNPGKSPFLTEN